MQDLQSRLTVVLQEGRVAEFVGVRLLLASLWRHAPDVRVIAFISPDQVAPLGSDLRDIHPNAQVVAFHTDLGWACKPAVLLSALERASTNDSDRVLWLDTDVIVLRGLVSLTQIDPRTLIVAEESNPNPNELVHARQELLGLQAGAPRETTLSSAVVGVTRHHRQILEQWNEKVHERAFTDQQTLPPDDRLLHGDQEVLEAILCSEHNRSLPVHILRNWNEMLQGTYTTYVGERGESIRVPPMFVHATGNLRPWRSCRFRLTQEIFPYFDAARMYVSKVGARDADFLQSRSLVARSFKSVATFQHYAMLRRMSFRLTSKLKLIWKQP